MIIKWNDEHSCMHGGNQTFKFNDPIPHGVIPESRLQFLADQGKIVIINADPIKKIKLSISVMAHPSREKYFSELRERLDNPRFSIDKKNNLIENCKASWKMYDPKADFHVVIQDDAIVCSHFRERAEQFITEREAERVYNQEPPQAYNFFLKRERNENLKYPDGYVIDNVVRGGVAVCMPVNMIEPMLVEFDKQTDPFDDGRITVFMRKNRYKCLFSIPSLVDHRDHEFSVAGNNAGNGRIAYSFIDNLKPTIPKIIHQLWIGPKPAPVKWMETWKKINPDWIYKLWTDKEIKNEKWINKKHIDYYYQKQIWHGVADVARYEILYNYGGCFFDADSECILPIDELFCDGREGYSCYENEKVRPGLIHPLIAAPKESDFAAELIEGLSALKEVGEPWKTTGNKYMGEMVRKTNCNVKIFPSHYFIPEHFTGEKYEGNGKIYARHLWGTTLENYETGV